MAISCESLNHHDLRAGEELLVIDHAPSGLRAFVALIEGRVPRAFGGVRRMAYSDDHAAQEDAIGLARQMFAKISFAGLPQGGAKTVIVDHDGLDVKEAYRALGRCVQGLKGRYFCGPDLGTGAEELALLGETTEYVNHVENDAGYSTALGVAAGLLGACDFLGWEEGLEGRTIFIEGVGSVGSSLARMLAEEGAKLRLADLSPVTSERVAAELRNEGFDAQSVSDVSEVSDLDVFCPCGGGGTVTSHSLHAKVICGSANRQIANQEVAELLHKQGVIYVPEVCVNAGAVVEGIVVDQEGDVARGRSHDLIRKTRDRVFTLLNSAQAIECSPSLAVLRTREG